MAKEIERKFLVARARPGASSVRSGSLASVSSIWLPRSDRSVRIRISDGATAMLTLKFGGKGRGRDEFEYPVPLAEAEEMQAFALGQVIEKTRHHVRHGGYLYEVDVFEGRLAGLVIAELETPDIVPAEKLPPWLGREVTREGQYYNASLALGEVPEFAA